MNEEQIRNTIRIIADALDREDEETAKRYAFALLAQFLVDVHALAEVAKETLYLSQRNR